MKKLSECILLFILLAFAPLSCEKPPDQPASVRISASESGLAGAWEALELTNTYAIPLVDENGEQVLDEKLETVYKDTTVCFYPGGIITDNDTTNVWYEVLYLRTEGDVNTFDFLSDLDMIGVDTAVHYARSVKENILHGYWHVLETHDPQGRVNDVTSLILTNPEDIHFIGNTKSMSIIELTADRLKLQYGFGESVNDSLITKTYVKAQ